MMLVNNYMRKNGQRRYDEKYTGYIGEMIINSKNLETVDVISFDIFDTLLKRNVPNNSEIFNIIEKKSGVFGFAKKE